MTGVHVPKEYQLNIIPPVTENVGIEVLWKT